MVKYCIAWTNTETGAQGHGIREYDHAMAVEIADALNRVLSEYHYEPAPVYEPPPDPPAPPKTTPDAPAK